MIQNYKRNMLIALTIFSLFIILFVSFIDVTRMNNQLKKDYVDKIELAEMNIMNSLRHLDEDYFNLDGKIAEQMKTASNDIANQYESNADFSTLDFNKLGNEYGMDIYIIDEDNEIIFSTFSDDIGMNFNTCCSSFAKLLDERRSTGDFIHDGIDLQQNTGKLIKYSYMPTKDKKYIIELSYDLTKNEEFHHFDFIHMMNEMKRKYTFIQSVAIHNRDYYDLNKSSIEHVTNNTFEWFNTKAEVKDENYTFIDYNNELDNSEHKIVKMKFNHTELEKAIQNQWMTFFIQLIGMFIFALTVLFIMLKMLEKPMYLAFHDRLTNLKNRAAFENEFSRLSEKQSNFGLLILDFDHFKTVNDTLGHDKGDLLLKFVATYIKNILPENTFFARFGGDEFVILVKDIEQHQELDHIATTLINSFNDTMIDSAMDLKLFNEGVQIMQNKNVTVSIGGAMYPKDGADLEVLFKNADIALYSSKERGKKQYTYYGDLW